MDGTTQFFVRPLDTAFFGPPEAQSAGVTHFAATLFPPSPRAFQGFVRTRLLETARPPLDLRDKSPAGRQEVVDLVGDAESLPDQWQIEGPFPVSKPDTGLLTPWVPAPQFLRQRPNKSGTPNRARFIALSNEDDAKGGVFSGPETSWPQSTGGQTVSIFGAPAVPGVPGFEDKAPLGGWINAANLFWALTGNGHWDAKGHSHLPPMVRQESRTGLSLISAERRAMDHMLYSREDLRFDGKGGFIGKFSAPLPSRLTADALTGGTTSFGRGNRLVALEPVDNLDPSWEQIIQGAHLPQEPDETSRFWLVLLTPARFDAEFFREGRSVIYPWLHGLHGISTAVRYIGAFLGNPVTLGGYSIAEHKARPNRQYVPAGSAWLFQLPHTSPAERGEILRSINGQHRLGSPDEARMGFGQVVVGLDWNEK